MRALGDFEARRNSAVIVNRIDAFACLDARKDIGTGIGDAAIVDIDRRPVIGFHQIMRFELNQSAIPDPRPVPSRIGNHPARKAGAGEHPACHRDESACEGGMAGPETQPRAFIEIEPDAKCQFEHGDGQHILLFIGMEHNYVTNRADMR